MTAREISIGVDIGSSAVKAVLFQHGSKIVRASERRPLRSRVATDPIYFEEDPKKICEIVFSVIGSLANCATEQGYRIDSIAFTGQMHGGLIVDSQFEPLTQFITWQDKRGNAIGADGKSDVEILRAVFGTDPTGVSVHSGFLITTLYWLITHRSLPSGAAHALGIYDWITSMLVGNAVSDVSSVAAWGMFDPVHKAWRTELVEAARIPETLLPFVVEPGSMLGTIDARRASELGLDAEVHVHAPIGDTQASFIGSECHSEDILLNFGTGSQSLWETEEPIASPGTDIRYLHNGRYLACAPTLAGGEAYKIVANFFTEIVKEFSDKEISIEEAFGVMDRLAASSKSEGLRFDPIFRGSKFRDDRERASISGIQFDNFHPAGLIRALAEGMVEEVAQPFFARKEKSRHSALVGGGNGIRKNAALRNIAESRFGMPMRLARFEEEAAVGAAMLCGRTQ